jgi:phage gpG-like protein
VASRVDTSRAVKRLERGKKAARNLRPVFGEIRPAVTKDLGEHFARGQSPDGAWPRPARSTWERLKQNRRNTYKRGRRKGRLNARGLRFFMNQLGRLKGFYRFKVSAVSMLVRTPLFWAGVHQHGGTVGHGARVPKREYMWASPRLKAAFAALVARHIARSI